MNLRWLWLDHFPPEYELSSQMRRKATQMAIEHQKREPKYHDAPRLSNQIVWPAAVLFIVAVFAALFVPVRINPCFAYIGILYPAIASGMYRARRPYIRRALSELGYPICIDCGYILRGVQGQCCPECGAEREPSPGKVET